MIDFVVHIIKSYIVSWKRVLLPGIFLGSQLLAMPAMAAEYAIALLGVFNSKAVFVVDGKRELLALGQSSVKGFTVVSIDAQSVVIEIDGQRKLVHMGSTVSADGEKIQGPQFAAPARQEVKVFPNRNGMYFVRGRINMTPVQFLVDTGATTVAMSSDAAMRLGIDFLEGQPSRVSTASGVAPAYVVNLSNVQVGAVSVPNVEAMVIEGSFPREILLGNSFLERMEISRDGKIMTLRRKW